MIYIPISPKSAYIIMNNKNSITRDVYDRNIQNISPKRKKGHYQQQIEGSWDSC